MITVAKYTRMFIGIHVDGSPDILPENLSELIDRQEEFILDPWKTFEWTHNRHESIGTSYCTAELAIENAK